MYIDPVICMQVVYIERKLKPNEQKPSMML